VKLVDFDFGQQPSAGNSGVREAETGLYSFLKTLGDSAAALDF
jgi:hypothetical protein